ncbi:hypothetical protein TNCV_4282901 [Trichonephila clavipes]|nr:hypothetical protein TNCV_4282901 [Trichonephila clavipes]
MKEGLIALNYECSKCYERMGLYERKSAVLDGDFEWVCSTITSQNIYGHAPTIILLTMRPSKLFVKSRCHAVPTTRKRSAVRNVLFIILMGHEFMFAFGLAFFRTAKAGSTYGLNGLQPRAPGIYEPPFPVENNKQKKMLTHSK